MSNWNLDIGIPAAENMNQTAFSAYSGGETVLVVLGGTEIDLETVTYNNGFGFTAGGEDITVLNAGTYKLDYRIITTASLLMSSTITRNGTSIPAMTCSPGISGSIYSGSGIVTLNAGDVLSLTFYGLVGTAVLASGAGAIVNIVRLV